MAALGERREDLGRRRAADATSPRPPADTARGRAARLRPRAPAPTASSRRLSRPWPTIARTRSAARRRLAEALHREGQRVADGGVAVDQRPVEVEDEKRRRLTPTSGSRSSSSGSAGPGRPAAAPSPRSRPSRRTRASAPSPSNGPVRDPRGGLDDVGPRDARSGRPRSSESAATCSPRRGRGRSRRTRARSTCSSGSSSPEAPRRRPARASRTRPPRRPAAAWRCESLPGDVVLGVLGRVLDRPDRQAARLQARHELDDDRGLAGVVPADERDDGGLAVRIEQERLAARQERPAPRRSGARSRPAGCRPRSTISRKRGEPVSRSIAGRVVELVGLGPPAEVERRRGGARVSIDPQAGLERPEARRGRSRGAALRRRSGPRACRTSAGTCIGRNWTPGSASAFERVGERDRVEPGRAEDLERPRRPAALREVRALEQAHARVDERRVGRRHVGRRRAPTAGPSPRTASRAPSPPPGRRRGRDRAAARRRRAARARRPSSRGAPGSGAGRRRSGSPSPAGAPSTAPPIGFGRSQTTKRRREPAQASIASSIVQM